MTASAPQQSIRHLPRIACSPAVRANKAVRPAKPIDIGAASGIVTEPVVHLLERPRIVHSGNRASVALHLSTLPISGRSVKGVPIFNQFDQVRNQGSGLLLPEAPPRRAEPACRVQGESHRDPWRHVSPKQSWPLRADGVDCLRQHHFVPAWPAGVVVDRRIFSNSAARGEPVAVEGLGRPVLPVDRRQDDCRSSPSLPQFHRGLHTWRHHIDSRTSNRTFSPPAPARWSGPYRVPPCVHGWWPESSTTPR